MSAPARILVADDEEDMRLGLAETLRGEGYQVEEVGDGAAALERAAAGGYDLALVDLRMPGLDGMGVLDGIRCRAPQTQVAVITGHASVESAVEAMKRGACDYLAKPFKLDQVRLVARRALGHKRLADENRRLRQQVESYRRFEQIVGQSPALAPVFEAIDKAAPTNGTVLVYGETGTGKELVARALHRRSARQGPFVAISCGAIAESLLESELFGHVRGAFTGAHADREGVFEAAAGGTLFLDEIGDISEAVQMKLLRVLQERQVQRVGESKPRPIDARVVAATHKDLRREGREGRFRDDLYYRLNVVKIEVPPLRDRPEDLEPLLHHFLEKFAREIGKPAPRVAPGTVDLLRAHPWPGNVRELENAVERAMILLEGDLLEARHLPLERAGAAVPHGQSLKQVERAHILRVLEETGFHQSRAAKILGIGRRTLYRKIREYGIEGPFEAE